MMKRPGPAEFSPAELRNNRRGYQPLWLRRCLWWGWFLLLLIGPGSLWAQTAPVDSTVAAIGSARVLFLAEVQLEGATRTSLSTVYKYLPLNPGQPIDQATLVESVAALRTGGLFKAVTFFTKPGAERGQLILVLEVEEHSWDFRWAAGNTDLDGWFLVPAMLAHDNPFGKGGLFDLQLRTGFRHSGLLLRYGQLRTGVGRNYWGTQLSLMETDRPYFSEGVEFSHAIGSSGLSTVFGRRYSPERLVEAGLKVENINVYNHSTAQGASQDGSIAFDQEIPEQALPPAIQSAVGNANRIILHLDWQHDSRSAAKRAGSPVAGIWGRVKSRLILQDHRTHLGLQADLRAFTEVPGGVLAARLRGAWVGQPAAFYDRLYLGGMYTVRGFPTHALSPAGGDTWQWSSSLEYRSRILGDAKGTKLAGILFMDAGASGTSDADDPYSGVAIGTGYGLRMRVWWLDWIGLDIGFPLTERPLDMRFQVTGSIGWSF